MNQGEKTQIVKPLKHFEYAVLRSVSNLRTDAYATEIARRLSDQLNRHVALAQVYVSLQKLEDQGFVTSSESEPTPVRGGRRRRIFVMQNSGRQALDVTAAAFRDPDEGTHIHEPEALEPSPA